MMSLIRSRFGVAQRFPDRVEVGLANMREDKVLRMGRPQFVEAVSFRKIGDHFHLFGRDVAADAAHGLQADVGDCIARRLVSDDLAVDPQREIGIGAVDIFRKPRFERGRGEISRDAVIFGLRKVGAKGQEMLELFLDLTAEFVFAQVVDQYLHSLLVDIVASGVHVPHSQDRLEIGENLRSRAEVAYQIGDEGGATHAAAGIDFEAFLAFVVTNDA